MGKDGRKRRNYKHFTQRVRPGKMLRLAIHGAIVLAWIDERRRPQVKVIGRNPRLLS